MTPHTTDLRAVIQHLTGAARSNEAARALNAALDGWADWPADRQQRFLDQIMIETVRQIVAELPGLPEHIAVACRDVHTRTAHLMATLAANAIEEVVGETHAASLAADTAAWAAAMMEMAAEDAARGRRARGWAAFAHLMAIAVVVVVEWAVDAAPAAADHIRGRGIQIWITAAQDSAKGQP